MLRQIKLITVAVHGLGCGIIEGLHSPKHLHLPKRSHRKLLEQRHHCHLLRMCRTNGTECLYHRKLLPRRQRKRRRKKKSQMYSHRRLPRLYLILPLHISGIECLCPRIIKYHRHHHQTTIGRLKIFMAEDRVLKSRKKKEDLPIPHQCLELLARHRHRRIEDRLIWVIMVGMIDSRQAKRIVNLIDSGLLINCFPQILDLGLGDTMMIIRKSPLSLKKAKHHVLGSSKEVIIVRRGNSNSIGWLTLILDQNSIIRIIVN